VGMISENGTERMEENRTESEYTDPNTSEPRSGRGGTTSTRGDRNRCMYVRQHDEGLSTIAIKYNRRNTARRHRYHKNISGDAGVSEELRKNVRM
jgi:hypothetical protein